MLGMEYEYVGRIIELVMENKKDYELLNELVSWWFVGMISCDIGAICVLINNE